MSRDNLKAGVGIITITVGTYTEELRLGSAWAIEDTTEQNIAHDKDGAAVESFDTDHEISMTMTVMDASERILALLRGDTVTALAATATGHIHVRDETIPTAGKTSVAVLLRAATVAAAFGTNYRQARAFRFSVASSSPYGVTVTDLTTDAVVTETSVLTTGLSTGAVHSGTQAIAVVSPGALPAGYEIEAGGVDRRTPYCGVIATGDFSQSNQILVLDAPRAVATSVPGPGATRSEYLSQELAFKCLLDPTLGYSYKVTSLPGAK